MKAYKFKFEELIITSESQEEAEERLSENLDKLVITKIEEIEII